MIPYYGTTAVRRSTLCSVAVVWGGAVVVVVVMSSGNAGDEGQ